MHFKREAAIKAAQPRARQAGQSICPAMHRLVRPISPTRKGGSRASRAGPFVLQMPVVRAGADGVRTRDGAPPSAYRRATSIRCCTERCGSAQCPAPNRNPEPSGHPPDERLTRRYAEEVARNRHRNQTASAPPEGPWPPKRASTPTWDHVYLRDPCQTVVKLRGNRATGPQRGRSKNAPPSCYRRFLHGASDFDVARVTRIYLKFNASKWLNTLNDCAPKQRSGRSC
jgi:hypothetical protein